MTTRTKDTLISAAIVVIAGITGIIIGQQAKRPAAKATEAITSQATKPPAPAAPAVDPAIVTASKIEAGVNQFRASRDLAPLADNPQLDKSAAAKANDMCAKNYWAHDTPDGATPWTFFANAGYESKTLGENLAKQYYLTSYLMSAWIASPEHLANIVGDYNEQGAAVLVCPHYQGGDNVFISVNHFGLRP